MSVLDDGFDPAAVTSPRAAVTSENNKPIGIFDSGIGGLTVARCIASLLPAESIYYVGDTKRCPYGPRPQAEVRLFVRQVGRWLERHDVKLVVIACNTATAAGLDVIQRALKVPVIGVIEPGARAAIQATRSRRVGVLATRGTVDSGAYERAIHNLDAGVRVTQSAAGSFVDFVERELATGTYLHEDWMDSVDVFDTPEVRELARRNVAPLLGRGVDTVVLGCTHFPLLAHEISNALGPDVRTVSSAEETAREVAEILGRRGELADPASPNLGAGGEPKYRFATTSDDITSFAVAGKFIFGHSLDSIEHIELDTLESLVD
ncbi:glutamate racemase [uncultured Parolsenella sp.]|uniref:glutamate racemase n=1 Tax=uncultured Parolsenella sp. TaxID=2083008 RepID=UPI0025E0A31C|nr:glutamate racemase [uncultured Parolsenella sp.]